MTGKMPRRQAISKFSKSSQRRLARVLLNNAERFKLMLTLTYRPNRPDCRVSKRHINNLLTRFRKECGIDVGYVWVLEFQERGMPHFHIWFDEFNVAEAGGWQDINVRKQILLRFKDDPCNLERFRFLTYLWLRITGQLEDQKAVRASTDLKVITSSTFVASYAVKYAWKAEQKVFRGNVNEATGEIVDFWTGRYWGTSRSVRNEKLYVSTNVKAVRVFEKWMGKQLGRKSFSGMWLLLDGDLRKRVRALCGDVERAGAAWEDEKGYRNIDPQRFDLLWHNEDGSRVRGVDEDWKRRHPKKKVAKADGLAVHSEMKEFCLPPDGVGRLLLIPERCLGGEGRK